MCLVSLRIAIGWHFLYEGLEKVDAGRGGGRPFSSEGYLRYATGPLAPTFRGMIPDVNGLETLDPPRLKARWADDVERVAQHYNFDADQRGNATVALKNAESAADLWFASNENQEKVRKYYYELGAVQKVERDPNALSFERERAASSRRDLDGMRRALTADLTARGEQLRAAVAALATKEQASATAADAPPWTQLDWINFATKWGLVAMGLALMAGFLTPAAALAGAVFLAQIYLSMPPWPGLPAPPNVEGHYWVVNKNLVEMLACLVIASTPSGLWVGVDALFFGRERRPAAREVDGANAARLEKSSAREAAGSSRSR